MRLIVNAQCQNCWKTSIQHVRFNSEAKCMTCARIDDDDAIPILQGTRISPFSPQGTLIREYIRNWF